MLLKLLHALGLTNLSDRQVARFYELPGRTQAHGNWRFSAALRKTFVIAVAPVVVVIIGGMGVLWANHVTVVPAPESAVDLPLLATMSHVSAPVTVLTSDIAAALEKAIPKSFPFDTRGDAHVYGNPSRGQITVANDVSAKRGSATTRVFGRVQVEKKVGAVNAVVGIDVTGSISATFAPTITKNWKINPQLQLSAHVDSAVAKTAVGDIDITGRVQGPVSDALNRDKSKIEDGLATKLNVRNDAENLWNTMNGVFRVADNPPTWLRITPRSVTLANFRYAPTAIESGLTIGLETQFFLQDTPPKVLKSPLPDPSIADRLPDDFDLSIPVEIAHAVINDQLTKESSKKPFDLGEGAWVEVTGARADAYGAGILLTVDFTGKKGLIKSASGRLYIVGVPVFDPEKQSNESAIKAVNEYMKEVASGATRGAFNISLVYGGRHWPRRIEAAMYHSAFLLMFAYFGYDFAFHPHFDPLRQQIRNPEGGSLKSRIVIPSADTVSNFMGDRDHAIMLLRKPSGILAFLRLRPKAGRPRVFAVVLPGLDEPNVPRDDWMSFEGDLVPYNPEPLLEGAGYLQYLWGMTRTTEDSPGADAPQ